MNCQDITRIIDSGKFSALGNSERRDAEEHAITCRHCAPLWMAHSRLGATVPPAMPPELSVRCLTLAAANSLPASRHASRRVRLVVGGIVALAAAAAMLAVDFFDNSTPPDQQVAVIPATPETPVQALPPVETPVSAPVAAVLPIAEARDPSYRLPLIPAPLRADAERKFQMDLAQRKALELYPEITSGPEIDGTFVVSLNLRADGTVLAKSLAIANSTEEVNIEMHKMKPLNGSQVFTGLGKGAQQEDGRKLRGNLTLAFSMVSSSFDLSRANARVEQIVRAERAHLMLPVAKGGMNTLTVLLSEDGAIQRENVEFISSLGPQAQGKRPAAADARAQEMARKLGVDVERIGVMGSTWIDNSASDRADMKYLMIDYAWPRRAGEVASGIAQDDNVFTSRGVDVNAALIVVERLMPEVFLQADRPASGPSTIAPAIVFTVEGQVIGVGRINLQSGELPAQQVQNFAPGVRVYMAELVSVRNAGGKSAQVHFFWEATPAQKEALDRAEGTAPAR